MSLALKNVKTNVCLLTLPEMGEILAKAPATLKKWLHQRNPKTADIRKFQEICFKHGKSWVARSDDLEGYIYFLHQKSHQYLSEQEKEVIL